MLVEDGAPGVATLIMRASRNAHVAMNGDAGTTSWRHLPVVSQRKETSIALYVVLRRVMPGMSCHLLSRDVVANNML